MFLSDALNIVHRNDKDVPAGYTQLYATTAGDDGVILFFLKDNRVNFIQSFTNSNDYLVGENPVVIKLTKNTDGSIALKQGDKFWSAISDTDRLELRPEAATGEYFFLDQSNYALKPEAPEEAQSEKAAVNTREFYRLRTWHKTYVFVNGALNIIHSKDENVPEDYVPLYATPAGDKVYLFFVKDGQVNYIAEFTDSKHFYFVSFPSTMDIDKNQDGSISFKQHNKFLSARNKDGIFDLRPKNSWWEHFFPEKTGLDVKGGEEENDMMKREFYRLRTWHKTYVFMTGALGMIHRSDADVPEDYTPIYVTPEGDEAYMFFVKNDRVNYISGLTNNTVFNCTGFPLTIGVLKNENGSISFRNGEKFWSARKGSKGLFELSSKHSLWEYFFPEKVELDITVGEEEQEIPPDAEHLFTIFEEDFNIELYKKDIDVYTQRVSRASADAAKSI